MSRVKETKADRQRIREADPIGKLLHLAEGKGLMLRDAKGGAKKLHYATMDQVIDIYKTLLKKTVPDLRSVDITAGDGEGLNITFVSKVPLPNQPDAIEHMKTVGEKITNEVADAIVEEDDDDDA